MLSVVLTYFTWGLSVAFHKFPASMRPDQDWRVTELHPSRKCSFVHIPAVAKGI